MNINDLPAGSFTVNKQGTGAPLNIKNLPQGSFSVAPPTQQPAPVSPQAPETPASQPNLLQKIGGDITDTVGALGQRFNNAATAESDSASGKIPAPEAGLRIFNQIAGAGSDILNSGFKAAGQTANAATGGLAGALADKTVQSVMKTPLGVQGVNSIAQGASSWSDYMAKHPRLAQDISGIPALANIIATFATGGEVKAAGETLAPIVGNALKPIAKEVTNTVTGAAAKTPEKIVAGITDAITPKLTPTEFKAAGRAGQTSEPTLLNGSKLVGSKIPTVAKAAQAIQDVATTLGKKATDVIKHGVGQVTGNLNRVTSLIGEYSDKVIKPLLTGNKVPFNFEDLQKSLNLVSPSSGLRADASAFGTYSRVREEVLNTAAAQLRKLGNADNATDFNDIWNVRKTIDSKIENELGEATFGTPQYTGVKAAARDMRQGLTQFIDNSLRYPGQMENVNRLNESIATLRQKGIDVTDEMLPALKKQFGVVDDAKGTAVADAFKTHIDKVRSLYDAADNLETKIGTETKSKVGQYLKAHPVVKRVGQAALTGLGLGVGADAAQHL